MNEQWDPMLGCLGKVGFAIEVADDAQNINSPHAGSNGSIGGDENRLCVPFTVHGLGMNASPNKDNGLSVCNRFLQSLQRPRSLRSSPIEALCFRVMIARVA
jgi:hypothetical protein